MKLGLQGVSFLFASGDSGVSSMAYHPDGLSLSRVLTVWQIIQAILTALPVALALI